MGERKVQCMFYPPDFDPSKIPRKRNQPKNHEMTVRMMLPMSIRCRNCGNFIGKGSKFNMNKEDVTGENYLGIQVYKFTFKCRDCGNELRFKTDPKNSDYVVEEDGATRNYEPWRDDEQGKEEEEEEEEEEMSDVLKCLEKKTMDSKREMEVMANLDEMKSLKQRHATVSTDAMLKILKQKSEEEKKKLEEEDDQLAKSIFGSSEKRIVRRLPDDDEEEMGTMKRRKIASEKELEKPKMKIVARASVTNKMQQQQQPKKTKDHVLKSLMEKYEEEDDEL